ncbi:MAG: tyrosine--tRNA ligase [Alphaproteobacteria bacterium]|jgi:tyrosyl-tRNA synthetase
MSDLSSDFMRTMTSRGFLHQCTDQIGLDQKAAGKQPIAAYIGFDCTADSLHVGSLVQIMMLRWLQKTGHKPIVLMGGGTTKIGDPSGKDEARQLITEDIIKGNMAGIKRVFEKFLTFGDGPTDAVMVDNAEWLDQLKYIPLLREVGRHFSVNRMLTMDSVRLRLDREQPLSFLEFNYMVLQAYDFAELARRHGCTLQMGGSDQWGNIVMGVDLARRMDGNEVFGMTTPLITTANGAKMGKTASGAIWLNEERLSAYDYWQFWRNTADGDVGRFLRLFTDLPLKEIEDLESLEGVELNEAKKRLATEATAMAHGLDAANAAAETARQTFEEGSLQAALPSIEVDKKALEAGVPAYECLRLAGLVNSNGEGRRLIKGGGARLNDVSISSEDKIISLDDAGTAGSIKLSAGKKRHVLLKPTHS